MKARWASIDNRAEDEQRRGSENHLPCSQHRGRDLNSPRLEKNVRVSRGRAAKNDSDAAPKGAYAAEIKQASANQRNSTDGKQSAGEFLQTQRLIRQHPVRKQHSEDWNCCLQNRS